MQYEVFTCGGDVLPLASVIDRFDEGFGLGLREDEKAGLVAYIEAAREADEPAGAWSDRSTLFRRVFDEFAAIASKLVTLVRREDTERALMLIERIAGDLAAEVRTVPGPDRKDDIYWLADVLAEVGQRCERGDWNEAQALWEKFNARQPG
jgi:hypothetical protein